MAEDFNEAPVAFEDKQKKLIEANPIRIDEIQCQTCQIILHLSRQIKDHIKEKDHYSIRIKRISKKDFEDVKCNICSESNVKKLYAILSGANIDEIKSIIYCKKDVPQGYENQLLMDIIEQDRIMYRKLNKVQLKYSNKERYYNIYKPLAIADMKYTRKLYEKKEEYEFELLQKHERYYFLVPENFCEINLTPGKILKFVENKESNDEDFEFLAVITKTEIVENKEENKLKISINPINRHVTSLKGHTGMYKIKEGFCLIPYERMMNALDSFVNDFPDDENEIYDRNVSLYLTERILGILPFDGKSDDENLKEKVEEILRIEKNSVEVILFDEKIELIKEIDGFGKLNSSQINALERIFKQPLNLIQGPPGTGKTFLSSFIIYNIFKKRKNLDPNDDEENNKILICTPSNSAADNLTSYLLRINKVTGGEMKILRVYAKTREYLEINKEIEKNSLNYFIRQKFGPDLDEFDKSEIEEETNKIIEDNDIIISTCSTSGDNRLKNLNFPFVIIDEATQCCELESMIPVVHGCSHLTLIGDQKQLGPVVLHPQAKKVGMNISLFERMIKLYPELLTMLTIQYRMHPEIVKFPSQQFYENRIQNSENLINERKLSEEFIKKFKWPKKDIPILFLHCEGQEKLSKTKSKFNEEEAKIVVLYIEKLINCGIDTKDIGVITPYIAQIDKIKSILIQKNIPNRSNLKISSVDAFQGGEKKFIILSNVRSNKENIIGFLEDFRRLNVSVTRAIYGMVVIGNAKCLYHDKSIWRNFINYYQKNHLIYSPKVNKEKDEEIVYDIDDLTEIEIGNDKDINIDEDEFVYGNEEDYQDINQDLIDNYESTSNIYAEGNKNYLNKKKEKNMKKYHK